MRSVFGEVLVIGRVVSQVPRGMISNTSCNGRFDSTCRQVNEFPTTHERINRKGKSIRRVDVDLEAAQISALKVRRSPHNRRSSVIKSRSARYLSSLLDSVHRLGMQIRLRLVVHQEQLHPMFFLLTDCMIQIFLELDINHQVLTK
jgi:hypothetical protein